MKRTYITLLLAAVAMCTFAAAPNGSGTYYQNANGKKGKELKTELRKIIYNRTEKSYDYLWTFFNTYDVRSDGKIWDMYSNTTNYVPGGSAQGHNYQGEGDSYNREHSFPKSWFNSNTPMYTDLHHMYPTDGFVNNKRSNFPFGETNSPTYTSENDFSKLGPCSYSGYTGTVFEPNDMYKGDFARTYFYMVTCYEEKLADWYSKNSESRTTINGTTYPAFQTWQLNMLMEWATNDPVSEKEKNRNNAVYGIQNNRNPFIDYPGLEQYIWGSKTNDTFSYNNYEVPEGYSSGSGGGGTTPTGGNKITISYSDIPDGFTATTGTSGSFSKTLATTNDLTVSYSGINTKSSATAPDHAYGYAMFLKNYGYIYNSSAPSGYYPSKVTATFSSGTGTSGKVGINFGTSAITTRNSSVTGSVTQSGTIEQTNTDESKLYWNFSTTGANVQVTKLEVVYTPILSDPITYHTPTTKTYGETFTLVNGTHFTTDGAVTLSSSNEAVATVSDLTVTSVAAGECIISVTYDAGTNYKASNSAFIFTVTQPAGKETAAPSTETVFEETFDGCNDKGGNDNKWSGSIATGTVTTDNSGWYFLKGGGASGCIKLGASSGTGNATTPVLGVAGTLYLSFRAGAWNSSNEKTTLNLSVSNGEITPSSVELTKGKFNTYTATITNATAGTKITFQSSDASSNRFFLDDVVVTKPGVTLTKTLNDYGYASYCSEYPLDFSDYESAGYSAWQVTGVSGETINFAQVTGKVKGGTGLILKGEPNETVTLHSANSTTTLDDNLLVGTIVDTYAETGQYFGLKGKAFVPVAESTVPEGKALLPTSLITSNEVKALNFVFEEDATGISLMEDGRSQMEDGVIYKQGSTIVNLAGQRLDNSQLKRGIYIVNGKKIMVK